MKVASALFLVLPLLSGVSAQFGNQRNQGNNGGNQGNNGGNQGNNGGNQGNNGANQGNNGGNNGGNAGGDPQTSLTLDPRVIAQGFANNGQNPPVDGQVASLTSTNNFINFCLTANVPITDGKQIQSGSCNPAPIGVIPNIDNMPSGKISNPKNGATIAANTAFNIEVTVRNFATGQFVNAQANYFAAPQTLNGAGQILGHSHVVMELLTSLDQVAPTDPKKFAFFKGLNNAAVGGKLSTEVTNGVPAGAYRICTINSSSNHQPVIVPVAQHGSLDDCVYVTATAGGANNGANNGANQGNNGANNGANQGNNGANNGANQGNNGANNGANQANNGANNGANQGNNGANNGANQGNNGANNGANQGNNGANNGANQGNNGANNGANQGNNGANNGANQGGNRGRGNGRFGQRGGFGFGGNRPRRLSSQH